MRKKDNTEKNRIKKEDIIIEAPASRAFFVRKNGSSLSDALPTYFGFMQDSTSGEIRNMTKEELKKHRNLIRCAIDDAVKKADRKPEAIIVATDNYRAQYSCLFVHAIAEFKGGTLQATIQAQMLPPMETLEAKRMDLKTALNEKFMTNSTEHFNDIYIVKGSSKMGDRTTWDDPDLTAFFFYKRSDNGFSPLPYKESQNRAEEFERIKNLLRIVARDPNGFTFVYADRKVPYSFAGFSMYVTKRPLSNKDTSLQKMYGSELGFYHQRTAKEQQGQGQKDSDTKSKKDSKKNKPRPLR